jgi:quinol monooxygenase YgiN
MIRLVRMTFRPDARDEFLEYFDASAPRIRAFEGCEHLQLWQGRRFPNVCTTFSQWTGEEALERYRRSVLFRETWRKVKPLFAAAPVAHSHAVLRSAEAIDAAAKEKPAG